jgi:hypothetical protein
MPFDEATDLTPAEVSPMPELDEYRRRPPPPPPRRPVHVEREPREATTTLTVSALQQGSAMASLSLSTRVAPKAALVLTGAAGGDFLPAWELAGGLDGYVLGDFRTGLSVGSLVGVADLGQGFGPSLVVTPRVGGKLTVLGPLTLEAYGGITVQPTAEALVLAASLRVGAGFTF